MGSIPKIVSTPLKWVSKQFINRTLLRFPGGDEHSPIACVYCPEMCRFSCPTAVVSGNDAVTPCNKNSLLYKEQKWPGQAAQGGELWTLYDCTGCGRCTEYCVYGMPVAAQLFEARKTFGWEGARQALLSLSDAEDPVGDLAEELGDGETARRRLAAFTAARAGRVCEVAEPKAVLFIGENGHSAALSWQWALLAAPGDRVWAKIRARLGERRWLLHESSFLNRRLGRSGQVDLWHERALGEGMKIERAFAHGKDCIDCGGEGAYARTFPEQAAEMARDIWERDRHRSEGILCMSDRCAAHLRQALGAGVLVESLVELTADSGP